VLTIVLVVAALALGVWAGFNQYTKQRLQERIREQDAEREHERQQIEELAKSAERSRILREMHDVVAHSLAVMIAQADGGRFSTKDEAAQRTFHTIADTGRAALADTRRILGVLRGGDAQLSPTPSERDLSHLVKELQEAGKEISFITLGEPREIPPAAGLALFRICQEALTNALKHAPDKPVVVTENWMPDKVALSISNPCAAVESDGRGLGLINMRERAESVGASFSAGPTGDTFRVRVEFPYPSGKEY
jgi:signal transduction histidine kinase